MAENQFDILIKFGLSKEKATEAVGELNKIKDATTATGKEGVKQEEQVTEATKKGIGFKQQAREAIKGLTREFPLLGQAAQLALSPITLAVAAVSSAVVILKNKFDLAVEAQGGFTQSIPSESAVARYERMATAAANIKTSLDGIKDALATFNQNKDILDSFAKGMGVTDPNDASTRAQAARESGDRASADAARLRAQAGNFNPNNAAAGDLAKSLPELQAYREKMLQTLNLINSIQDGTGGVIGSAKYLASFGLVSPDKKAQEYTRELAQTDAQIAAVIDGGRRRGARADAFGKANASATAAAGFYGQAADLGGSSANAAGAAFIQASGALANGNLDAMIANILKMAEAFAKGRAATDKALEDSDRAAAIRNRKP